MSNTSDSTTEYNLPPLSSSDREMVERMYRGVCQEIEGLSQQLKGKQQVKSALKSHLERDREGGS